MDAGALLHRCGAALLAATCCLMPAAAANLQISPVNIVLRADQAAAGIVLQNLGETPLYGQVRVFAWDQRDGQDVLLATQLLVASPPLVNIAPHTSQTIRLVRTGAAPANGELTYRVLIDELAREGSNATSGVDIRLRYSVPVFVQAAEPGAELLHWQVLRKDAGWTLRIGNKGPRSAQIGQVTLRNHAGAEFAVSSGLFGYVLSGREREWTLAVPAGADLKGALAISAMVNARPVSASSAAAD